ncbi:MULTISPECIES: hypothetical protein [Salinicoccus]|uniref:Uncharacterized protein n=2 Tax=Salinicoccus TaxID=45669 RepID=A0ABV5Z1I0_9STAP
MKNRLHLSNEGFFSFSMYIVLIYMAGVYYHYHNRFMMIIEIQSNFIEIYNTRIQDILG